MSAIFTSRLLQKKVVELARVAAVKNEVPVGIEPEDAVCGECDSAVDGAAVCCDGPHKHESWWHEECVGFEKGSWPENAPWFCKHCLLEADYWVGRYCGLMQQGLHPQFLPLAIQTRGDVGEAGAYGTGRVQYVPAVNQRHFPEVHTSHFPPGLRLHDFQRQPGTVVFPPAVLTTATTVAPAGSGASAPPPPPPTTTTTSPAPPAPRKTTARKSTARKAPVAAAVPAGRDLVPGGGPPLNAAGQPMWAVKAVPLTSTSTTSTPSPSPFPSPGGSPTSTSSSSDDEDVEMGDAPITTTTTTTAPPPPPPATTTTTTGTTTTTTTTTPAAPAAPTTATSRKPQSAWTAAELAALVAAVSTYAAQEQRAGRSVGEAAKFRFAQQQLVQQGFAPRSAASLKNKWNREGRAQSGIEERKARRDGVARRARTGLRR